MMSDSIPMMMDPPGPPTTMPPSQLPPSPRRSGEGRKSRRPSRTEPATGAGYNWILDHILTYPATYEIPLRTMYSLNAAPRAQPLPQSLSRPASETSSRKSRQSGPPSMDAADPKTGSKRLHQTTPVDSPRHSISPPPSPQQAAAQDAAAQFKLNLMAQIATLPTQPCSLPPSFITAFVRRCFPDELAMVDFPQALTGLDYLRDLDIRRRRELVGALRRLNIDRENLGTDGEARPLSGNRAIAEWVKEIDDKEKKVEALYTQVYIGLRRWIIINEMALPPFNKSNCVAMLNTLYPPPSPAERSQPTKILTSQILAAQRDGFFRYIQSVEKSGPAVLEHLMAQGRRADRGEANGWPAVREVLVKYLRACNGVIDECSAIPSPEEITDSMIPTESTEDQRRNGRKVDSGVSFASQDRPSTSHSSTKSNRDKPLPSPPIPTKSGSALEKIARELRKLRDRKKADDDGVAAATTTEKTTKAKANTLKKMKSTSALGDMREKNRSFLADAHKSAYQPFDIDEETRRRAILEARDAGMRASMRMKYQPLRTLEV